MSAASNVIPLVSDAALNAAWSDYQSMAKRAVDEPRLLTDRAFFDEMTRREGRYKRLLLASDKRL